MRIMRFQDEKGKTHYGIDEGQPTAAVLEVNPFGQLEPTDEAATVAKRLAPIEPRTILCIGLNYRQHAIETNVPIPQRPVLFMKNPAALNHPDEAIVIPACTLGDEVDYEAELAVVIGKRPEGLREADASKYVLGYTCGNRRLRPRLPESAATGSGLAARASTRSARSARVLVIGREIRMPTASAACSTAR